MKRVLTLLLLAAVCCGCSRERDPYRVDTVIRIPVSPTSTAPTAVSAGTDPTADPAWENGIWNGGWFETGPGETENARDKQSSKQDNHPSRETAVPEWTVPPATPEAEPEPTRYTIAGYMPGAEEYGLLGAINEFRRSAGMPELLMDETLCAIVSMRSYEQSQYWSHTRPDGRDYATVLADYGYPGEAVAELSARISGAYAPETAAEMWLQSPSHSGMLLAEASIAGIGLFRSGDVVCICVMLVK